MNNKNIFLSKSSDNEKDIRYEKLYKESQKNFKDFQKINIFNLNNKSLPSRIENIINGKTNPYGIFTNKVTSNNKEYILFTDQYLDKIIKKILFFLITENNKNSNISLFNIIINNYWDNDKQEKPHKQEKNIFYFRLFKLQQQFAIKIKNLENNLSSSTERNNNLKFSIKFTEKF